MNNNKKGIVSRVTTILKRIVSCDQFHQFSTPALADCYILRKGKVQERSMTDFAGGNY